MRIRVIVLLLLVFGVSACQPEATLQEGPRLVGERTLEAPAALPTLLILPTNTPLLAATRPATESVAELLATAQPLQNNTQSAFDFVTPTFQPSKTPTITPTHTGVPTQTQPPPPTLTPSPLPTLNQFVFGTLPPPTALPQPINPFLQQPAPAAVAQSAQNALPLNCAASTWFFTQYIPPVCPSEQPVVGGGVFQRFEFGYMVWLAANDKIYVMYTSAEFPRWQIYDDLFEEGMPEIDESWEQREPAPPQTWQPRRGFGTLWRQFPDLRRRIGWAVQEWELIYEPRLQRGADGSISIEDPSGGVFYLAPRGSNWELYRFGE